jgi:hypothetical protein
MFRILDVAADEYCVSPWISVCTVYSDHVIKVRKYRSFYFSYVLPFKFHIGAVIPEIFTHVFVLLVAEQSEFGREKRQPHRDRPKLKQHASLGQPQANDLHQG